MTTGRADERLPFPMAVRHQTGIGPAIRPKTGRRVLVLPTCSTYGISWAQGICRPFGFWDERRLQIDCGSVWSCLLASAPMLSIAYTIPCPNNGWSRQCQPSSSLAADRPADYTHQTLIYSAGGHVSLTLGQEKGGWTAGLGGKQGRTKAAAVKTQLSVGRDRVAHLLSHSPPTGVHVSLSTLWARTHCTYVLYVGISIMATRREGPWTPQPPAWRTRDGKVVERPLNGLNGSVASSRAAWL